MHNARDMKRGDCKYVLSLTNRWMDLFLTLFSFKTYPKISFLERAYTRNKGAVSMLDQDLPNQIPGYVKSIVKFNVSV